MGALEIHCHNCGAVYEVHPDIVIRAAELQTGVHPYRCPHCMTKMNTRTWDKLVRAFWEFEEVNRELRQEHDGYNRRDPLMQASYKTHYVPLENIK